MKKWMWWAAGIGAAALGGVIWSQSRGSTEQAPYRTLESDDDEGVALREYAPLVVAEVIHTGDRRRALDAGFKRLASYIFAKERSGDKIAMTTPVMQDAGGDMKASGSGTWRTRFVMPAHQALATLPPPPADIELIEVPSRKMAAIKFAGLVSDDDLARNETRLRTWLSAHGMEAAGPAEYAYYDGPMVPPPLRRNEVLLPIG